MASRQASSDLGGWILTQWRQSLQNPHAAEVYDGVVGTIKVPLLQTVLCKYSDVCDKQGTAKPCHMKTPTCSSTVLLKKLKGEEQPVGLLGKSVGIDCGTMKSTD